jgi:hypothetical protein
LGVATTLLSFSGTKNGVISTMIPTGRAQITFTSDGSVCYASNPSLYSGLNISFAVDNDYVVNNNLHVSGNTQTNGNELVAGNLGIGTTTPTKKLEILEGVGGRFTFSAANCTSGYEVAQTINNTGYKLNIGTTVRDYRIAINGTDKFAINTSGYTGIGTGTPRDVLEVFGNNISPKSSLRFTGTTQAAKSYIQSDTDGHYMEFGTFGTAYSGTMFGVNLAGSNSFIMAPKTTGYGIFGTTTATPLIIGTNNAERIRISSAGFVGIGTNSPQSNLHVYVPGSSNPINAMSIDVASFSTNENAAVSSYFKVTDIGGSNTPFVIKGDGKVGIGTTIPDALLTVNGTIHAKEVNVTVDIPADYVFHPSYNLMPLNQVEQFVKTNSHLPEIPSADEITKKGMSIGEMQNKLLQKVEELTLYVIEQQKEIEQLKQQLKK